MKGSLIALALVACIATPVWAQQTGGVKLSDDVLGDPDAQGKAVFRTMQLNALASSRGATGGQVQAQTGATNDTSDLSRFQAKHQQMITGLRGDSGFLGGFRFGQATQQSAFDRMAKPVPADGGAFVDGAFGGGDLFIGEDGGGGRVLVQKTVNVTNNFEGPASFVEGNGNIVQQNAAGGGGPTAQQQIVTETRRSRDKAAGIPGSAGQRPSVRRDAGRVSGGGNSNIAVGPGATAQQQVVTIAR
jgi:hypothetical protein